MKKHFGSISNLLLLLLGVMMLLGKNHYLLGSVYGVLLWPFLILIGIKFWIARARKRLKQEKYLLILGGLLLASWTYDHIPRINWDRETVEQRQLNVLTYNLFFKNQYPQQIINEIKVTKPDVLMVQELTPEWNTKLQPSVYARYKYRKTFLDRRTHGFGIFSTYPILSHHLIKNERSQAIFQICELLIDGKKIVMINAHMASPAKIVEQPDLDVISVFKHNYAKREAQWAQLEAYLGEHFPEHPKVIAGDLNTMKIEGLYRQIRHQWVDAFAKQGEGWRCTFPNVAAIPFPVITLDYILGQGIKPLEAKVLKGGSSDHFAVWAKIAICE
ncbi:MAG: endonuclease/exonuclease/phosphatase family protein [Bacteroidia bacterium]